jgi:hypothetical protein
MWHVWGGGERRTRFWWSNLKEKILLERPRCLWESNIKINVKGIILEDIGWTDLVQDRGKWRAVLKPIMNFVIP